MVKGRSFGTCGEGGRGFKLTSVEREEASNCVEKQVEASEHVEREVKASDCV